MPRWIATVGYVHSLGIRSLSVWCTGRRLGGYRCNHETQIDLSSFPDDLPCVAIERRLVCTHCGAIGAVDARPNWTELNNGAALPSRDDSQARCSRGARALKAMLAPENWTGYRRLTCGSLARPNTTSMPTLAEFGPAAY
jgi:hypothetical protein